MTHTDKEALKLALSCIRSSAEYKRGNASFIEAAEDVEQALAAPVQEPVAWMYKDKYGNLNQSSSPTVPPDSFPVYTAAPVQKRPPNCGTSYCSCIECIMPPAQPAPVKVWEAEGYDALMQEMQMVKARNIRQHAEIERLKAAQRQWVGLTDEERNTITRHHAYVDNIIRATEAKLKGKNT